MGQPHFFIKHLTTSRDLEKNPPADCYPTWKIPLLLKDKGGLQTLFTLPTKNHVLKRNLLQLFYKLEEFVMNKRKIYILLTDTGTLFTRLIKFYTKSPLNHASIAFDIKLKDLYSFGRKKPHNPFNGGFVRENIENHLFKRATCEVYSCLITETEYQSLSETIQRIKINETHYKYNLLGLFGIILNKEVKRKNAYFCSQFVTTLLSQNGIILTDKSPGLSTPQDIRNSDRITLEYRGELCYYPFFVIQRDSREPEIYLYEEKRSRKASNKALAFQKIRRNLSS